MMIRRFALAIMLMFFALNLAMAQGDAQLWLTYNNQTRLSDKWGYTFDVNYRTRGFFPFNSTLAAARVGGIYFVSNRSRISGGYAWFGTYVSDFDINLLPEHRLWQQIQWIIPKSKFQLVHRFRLEQRFRQELLKYPSGKSSFAYTTRARYMVQFQGLLLPPKTPDGFQISWQTANEIMFHSGDIISSRLFNQNRTLAGVVISPNRKFDFAVLYQLILQYQPVLDNVEEIHSIRLTAFHTLDYRKNR
ncbi:DUF2490 domain-containing protein [Aquiflexum gelatinilyticum]|uniref:DUF2490 domain-containing protein n=1 Tax=Aquiflexum gelatinilyticum TaxID=2961943 RepID=A0A9X2P2X1_9BACT|nr:DUF2490 domain-containing protein [Aquiflexum gelatinilyticum]MCR9013516.1 DUF2490 domain-containing protein [Aquiflexum gelatinilyticum]